MEDLTVTYYQDDKSLVFVPAGKIDSSNAAGLETEIYDVLDQTPSERIVLDFAHVEYISSAGLRVILRLLKTCKDTKLINVSASVYEILEMTGFTEMMEVQKVFRELSISGCELIGKGAVGSVYKYDAETIVKAFKPGVSLEDIREELDLARTVFVLGVPTAIPYDVVKISDEGWEYGTVFEMLNAMSLGKLMSQGKISLDDAAKLAMDLLKQINGTHTRSDKIPSAKSIALGWLKALDGCLPPDQYDKLLALITDLPEADNLIHGDFHMQNVMYQNGECILIDMDHICSGHPVFELSALYNSYVGYSETEHQIIVDFQGITAEQGEYFWKKCLQLYLDTDDEKVFEDVARKLMTISYMRIASRQLRHGWAVSEKGRRVIENAKAHLAELLPLVDTLAF